MKYLASKNKIIPLKDTEGKEILVSVSLPTAPSPQIIIEEGLVVTERVVKLCKVLLFLIFVYVFKFFI